MADPIDLTQDSGSEDGDLKLAIALSLAEQDGGTPPRKPVVQNDRPKSPQVTANTILGLDRKKMEQERLARQAQLKRKRGDEEISPPPLTRRTRSPPAQSPLNGATKSKVVVSASSLNKSTTTDTPETRLEYPNGIIKRTYVSSHPRTPRDITFPELVDAPNLKSALLSSYIWDFDWLFTHFRTKITKFVLVMHAHSLQHRTLLRQDFDGVSTVRLCFPSTEGIVNCMHSKLMLLFYEGRCRVVVPTANLMAFDWGEQGGFMENSVFIIDLPLRTVANTKQEQAEQTYPFYTSLLQLLHAQDVPADVIGRVSKFNFSATEQNNIAFVHTIGGAHTDESIWRSTGHCGLGRTVKKMGLGPRKGEEIEIDFVTSSVGSLTDEFMRGMFFAAAGDDGMVELGIRQGKVLSKGGIDAFFKGNGRKHSTDDEREERTNSQKSTTTPALPDVNAWRRNFRFFFPSHQTVATSIGGTDSAGTICFQRRWWENASKFPRANMRDCISVRPAVLMHNKIMFVRYKGREKEREHAGWVYVGSANLSESAWGRLVVDRTKKGEGVHVKLNCRNWECGVVVPVPKKEGKEGLSIFESVIPVPMEYPGKSYEENSGMEPWFFGKEGMAA